LKKKLKVGQLFPIWWNAAKLDNLFIFVVIMGFVFIK